MALSCRANLKRAHHLTLLDQNMPFGRNITSKLPPGPGLGLFVSCSFRSLPLSCIIVTRLVLYQQDRQGGASGGEAVLPHEDQRTKHQRIRGRQSHSMPSPWSQSAVFVVHRPPNFRICRLAAQIHQISVPGPPTRPITTLRWWLATRRVVGDTHPPPDDVLGILGSTNRPNSLSASHAQTEEYGRRHAVMRGCLRRGGPGAETELVAACHSPRRAVF